MGTGHGDLKKQIFSRYGADPRLRIWNTPTGQYRYLHSEARIKIGITGQPDIMGVRKSDGRLIGIEVKVGRDKLSDEQKAWAAVMGSFGAVVIEARCVEDVEKVFY